MLEAHGAGSPTDEAVRWIALKLAQQMLARAGYRHRSLRKELITGDVLAWQEDRAEHYPHAQEILLTFDAGGANVARSRRFKEDPVPLSRRLGLRLRAAHYPPYTSKWHPIEHRLFCHVERRLSGVILDSPQIALEAVQRTHTQTRLTVTARLLDTLYELERNVLRHSSISKTNSLATTLFSGNGTTSSMTIDFRYKMYYLFLNRYCENSGTVSIRSRNTVFPLGYGPNPRQ